MSEVLHILDGVIRIQRHRVDVETAQVKRWKKTVDLLIYPALASIVIGLLHILGGSYIAVGGDLALLGLTLAVRKRAASESAFAATRLALEAATLATFSDVRVKREKMEQI